MHVRMADQAVLHRPAAGRRQLPERPGDFSPRSRSRTRTPCTRAYGFLAENAAFCEICGNYGVRFIGPSSERSA